MHENASVGPLGLSGLEKQEDDDKIASMLGCMSSLAATSRTESTFEHRSRLIWVQAIIPRPAVFLMLLTWQT